MFRALNPDQVNALTGQLISAFQGQGDTINEFLTQTGALTNTLADRDQLIGDVITNLNTVLGSIGDQNTQFAKAVDSLSELMSTLAQRKGDISNAVAYANSAAGGVADLLAQARPAIKQTVVPQLDRAAGIIVADKDYVDNLLSTLPELVPDHEPARALRRLLHLLSVRDRAQVEREERATGLRQDGRPGFRKVHAAMKSFSERNPFVIGAIGAAITIGLVLFSLNYQKIPIFNQDNDFSAYFAEAGGLAPGAAVQVSGYKVGSVGSISLEDSNKVLVTFTVDKDIRIGDRSEAAIKTKSLLGAKIVEVTPRGDGELTQPIALERTRSPYQLPDALGDLTSAISGLDTDQLSTSLNTLVGDLRRHATGAEGGGRRESGDSRRPWTSATPSFASSFENANKVTGVLSERSDQVLKLLGDTNALLAQLNSESAALDQIAGNISAVTQQIKGFIGDNRASLKPAVDKLSGVVAIVQSHKEDVQKAIKGLVRYATGLGESVGSGPFFKAYVSNLLPGQFVQPFIDAAFSDLGLDPNVLAPSQRSDPQVGQPGTPCTSRAVPAYRTGR